MMTRRKAVCMFAVATLGSLQQEKAFRIKKAVPIDDGENGEQLQINLTKSGRID